MQESLHQSTAGRLAASRQPRSPGRQPVARRHPAGMQVGDRGDQGRSREHRSARGREPRVQIRREHPVGGSSRGRDGARLHDRVAWERAHLDPGGLARFPHRVDPSPGTRRDVLGEVDGVAAPSRGLPRRHDGRVAGSDQQPWLLDRTTTCRGPRSHPSRTASDSVRSRAGRGPPRTAGAPRPHLARPRRARGDRARADRG